MARIDKGLVILVGRDRENPRTHRDAFQITGGLGEMLDEHIKRNNLNKSEFIREAIAAKLEAETPKEPLIKDEKIRKAVRAWAEANDMSSDSVVICGSFDDGFETDTSSIEFDCTIRDALRGLKRGKSYTIAELCGEEEE